MCRRGSFWMPARCAKRSRAWSVKPKWPRTLRSTSLAPETVGRVVRGQASRRRSEGEASGGWALSGFDPPDELGLVEADVVA